MKVLILGAGIYGLSTALHLVLEGVDVEILDRGPIPNKHSSSYDHHRLIRHAYGPKKGYANLIPDAFLAWDRLWTQLERCEYVQTGCLALGKDDESWLSDSADSMNHISVEHEWWNMENVRKWLPWIHVEGNDQALYSPKGGILRAGIILEALAEKLRSLGAVLRPSVEITSLDTGWSEINMGRTEVSDSAGTRYTADHVLSALGASHFRLFPGEITSYRQVHAQFDQVPSGASVESGSPMVLDIGGHAGFYFVPGSASFPAKIGDHVSRFQGGPYSGEPVSEREIQNVRSVIESRTQSAWSKNPSRFGLCHYSCTNDHNIRFKSTPSLSSIYGGSGHGFKFGALFGEYVAQTIIGKRQLGEVAALISGTSEAPGLQ